MLMNAPPRDETLSKKYAALCDAVRNAGSCVVAYSGGVDSTLLAVVARRELGDRAVAVLARSPSLASAELEGARRRATEL
ncbi:MAG: TIGR00268 family protein, partial [Myxococcales bacterium]|nr:TIGR00268 family protein [Myxococcales bacterium]